jgi:hypothetical protein
MNDDIEKRVRQEIEQDPEIKRLYGRIHQLYEEIKSRSLTNKIKKKRKTRRKTK